MRFLLSLVSTIALAWILGLWLPYWSLSLAAMAIGFLLQPGAWKALLAGVLAGALLWGGMAYAADVSNGHILATRVGAVLGTSASGMLLITTALGALLAGLGVLLGDRLRSAVS